MTRRKSADDLTEEEIRYLLSARLRSASYERLERFRRTGRMIQLAPDNPPFTLDKFLTNQVDSDEECVIERSEKPRKSLSDTLLLFIEVAVVLGFLYFVIKGIGLHHLLNRTVAIALQLPTITPTPLISAIVLPTGHVHTSLPSGSTPKDAGIPQNLHPLIESPASVIMVVPTPAPQHGIRIQIPAINVDAPIVHGDDWEQLKKGVAHHDGSANPGQTGNIVLSGHNDTFGEVFRYLEDLKPGDRIIVYTSQREYTYVVSGWELVEPTRVEVMAPTLAATITLISCHPYLIDNHRIIVKGNLTG